MERIHAPAITAEVVNDQSLGYLAPNLDVGDPMRHRSSVKSAGPIVSKPAITAWPNEAQVVPTSRWTLVDLAPKQFNAIERLGCHEAMSHEPLIASATHPALEMRARFGTVATNGAGTIIHVGPLPRD